MKKFALLIGFVFMAAIVLSSCRKCITCTAYDRSTNSVQYTQDYCGPKPIVDNDEKSFKDTWDDSYNYTTCVTK